MGLVKSTAGNSIVRLETRRCRDTRDNTDNYRQEPLSNVN